MKLYQTAPASTIAKLNYGVIFYVVSCSGLEVGYPAFYCVGYGLVCGVRSV